ncbi:GNAT family N-acetyltransferase [Erwinia phyllosphaerae]|uniref:GNAT family N-acetyltransferase n=1 Tax=Erwinia phyllosphaerae TaxID=2853256 RepID=UPI001FEFBB27|nr:GNAT family N-acetyltransferase [Erwinia phyllosphaerae]MBV4367255.1 GNAT family N-acetyltransferase [Erwinia phyllosphaerae]
MAVVIRYGTPDDAEQLAYLVDLYRQFYGEKSNLTLSLQFISERLYLGDSKIMVATDGDDLVGFIQLFPSFSTVTLQRLWILNDLYVVEEWRSRHVGLQLLQAAKAFALKNGAKEIFIEGAVANTRARRVYEIFGFIENTEYKYFHLPLNSL